MRYSRNVKIGKTDVYEAIIDPKWLGSETILTCGVTASPVIVTIGTVTITGNIVSFVITGVSVGMTTISFEINTGTRTNCRHADVLVENC